MSGIPIRCRRIANDPERPRETDDATFGKRSGCSICRRPRRSPPNRRWAIRWRMIRERPAPIPTTGTMRGKFGFRARFRLNRRWQGFLPLKRQMHFRRMAGCRWPDATLDELLSDDP
jgi:hypothetical protein